MRLKAADELAREGGGALPAAEAVGGHAGVDEHEGDGAGLAGGEEVGPELALDEGGGVGAPVVEEAGGPGGDVEGDEAVEDAVGAEAGEAAAQGGWRR